MVDNQFGFIFKCKTFSLVSYYVKMPTKTLDQKLYNPIGSKVYSAGVYCVASFYVLMLLHMGTK